MTLDSAPPRSEPEPSGYAHSTVMLAETLAHLGVRDGGVYVDATLGGGGHAEGILKASRDSVVLGVDRDPASVRAASRRLARFAERFVASHGAFGDLLSPLKNAGLTHVDGIVCDLGLSSAQLSDASRGMSFRLEGPIDMRMDPSLDTTALDLIGGFSRDELAAVIFHYGQERRSRSIARCIKLAESEGRLCTTLDLRRAVVRAVGPTRVGGVDPATRTFQALRIAVNGELDQLAALLEQAPSLLAPNGVLVIISFHSLEDSLVKRAFRNREMWTSITKKPLCPSEAEERANPRSRSAKLRAARAVERADESSRATREGSQSIESASRIGW